MTIKVNYNDFPQTYFCTFTCINWLELFQITGLYDQIYKWFKILIKNHHQITGFVIMPNHLHILIHIRHDKQNINKILGNAKRFFAYEIVKRLKEGGRDDLLNIMSSKVKVSEKLRKKQHRVFEVSSDIKICQSQKFLLQKLEYIHENPIKGKWKLANSFEKYFHSSAGFYELNIAHPLVDLTHYQDLGDAVYPDDLPVSSLSGDDT